MPIFHHLWIRAEKSYTLAHALVTVAETPEMNR